MLNLRRNKRLLRPLLQQPKRLLTMLRLKEREFSLRKKLSRMKSEIKKYKWPPTN